MYYLLFSDSYGLCTVVVVIDHVVVLIKFIDRVIVEHIIVEHGP